MSTTPGLGIIVAGAVGSFGQQAQPRLYRAIDTIIANITEEERHYDDLEITQHPVEYGALISDHAFKRPPEITLRVMWSNSPGAPKSLLTGLSGALTNALSGAVQNQLTDQAYKQIGGSALGNLAVANLATLISTPLVSYGAQVNSGTGKGTSRVQDVYRQLLELQASAVPFTVYTGKRRYDNMLMKSLQVETDKRSENALVALITCQQVLIVRTSIVSTTPVSSQADPARTAAPVNSGTKQAFGVNTDGESPLRRSLSAVFGGINGAVGGGFGGGIQ